MARLFRTKAFLLIIITIISLIALAYTSKNRTTLTFYENIASYVYVPIQKGITYVGKSISDTLDYFSDAKKLAEEKKVLTTQIDELKEKNRKLSGLESENNRLREFLNLKSEFQDYDVETSRIIAKESGNWFNMFSIDKGSKDGIGFNMAVISPKGLVGQTVSVASGSSKVISIIDSQSSISGRLSRTRDLVILRGDMKLKDDGLLKMLYIPVGAELNEGDIVETSGLGGIFPPGILVGKIKSIDRERPQAVRYAVVEPAVDFKRLEEVAVLKSKQ